jgi:CubicO group peptidase (beta-lactamase class C family)
MSHETRRVSIEAELDASFEGYVRAGQAPGLAYGIVGPQGLVHAAGFGRANDSGATPDAGTPFPIASMSKSFVAATTLLLRDRGRLPLDDPITRYVPEFRADGAPDDPCEPPTLRMLLSMSGGLTEDNSWVDQQIGMADETLLGLVGAGLKYSSTPGVAYEYSNLGYALVGVALERICGEPIEDLVTRELIRPLGLTATTFSPSAYPVALRAAGHRLDGDRGWLPLPVAESDAFASAGGIVSTVQDMAVWITWLGAAFRPGPDGAAGVLSRASRRELQRVETVIPPVLALQADGAWRSTTAGYGLGLVVEHDLYRGQVVSHSGGLPGYLLHMRWHPSSGHGIVVLTNSHRGDPVALATGALSRLLTARDTPSQTVVLWPETVRMRQRVERLIRGWDPNLAEEVFATNVDLDQPLDERRAQIEQLVAAVGPLREPYPMGDVVSAATAADVTWAIPGERGELICMIHLDQLNPPRVQELAVAVRERGVPRSAAPLDISPRRATLGAASLTALPNVAVVVPELSADGADAGAGPTVVPSR